MRTPRVLSFVTRSIALQRILCVAGLSVLTACAQPQPERTPGPTATSEPSATSTPTATPTPTPTLTAVPMQVFDRLRTSRLATPVPQRGAPCGIVDLLDFPLGPPDGDGFAARWNFGRLSSRYNGIHAGEDWVRTSGNSLGQPVYAIGHGMVTYAQPLGWGVDKGVVIVRHIFTDGSTFLSFYGHLDPPSVVLRPGDCVQRGDEVGAVGQPRGRAHLHFEIRTHLPDDPGPGYWPVDPQRAGWKIPSDTIWTYRIDTSPGVQWTRSFTATGSTGFGVLNDGTLVALDDRRLIGIEPGDGSLRWTQSISYTVYRSTLDAGGASFYVSDFAGVVHALDAQGQERWQVDFDSTARPELMPLPGGGVVVYAEQQWTGVSAEGQRLWRIDRASPPDKWVLNGDELIFTTDAESPVVHRLDRSGQLIWAARIGGRPVAAGDQVYVYNATGVYRLNPDAYRADLILPLDPTVFETGDVAALPDGSLIVLHRGPNARRLLGLNPDGSLRWDRALAEVGRALPQLTVAGDRIYLFTIDGDVMSIDPADGNARRAFDGGSGTRLEGTNWAFVTVEGRIVLDFRGGKIVAVDPQQAVEVQAGSAP